MHPPGRHDRTARKKRFNTLAFGNAPEEVSRIDFPVPVLGKIRGWRRKEISPFAPPFVFVTVAIGAFFKKGFFRPGEALSVLVYAGRHLALRVVRFLLIASEQKQNNGNEINANYVHYQTRPIHEQKQR